LRDVADRVHVLRADLTDADAVRTTVREAGADVILHLAAYTHVGRSFSHVDECIQANVVGTANLLQAAEGTGYRRFVYTSTSEVYGAVDAPFREDGPVDPISPYSVTKYAGELMCRVFHRAHGSPIVVLRPFNAYGPGQTTDRIIPEVNVSAIRGNDVKMTSGKQTREFNFVEDLADGFILTATADDDVNGRIINLACGEERSIREIAETILEMMGHPVRAEIGAIPHRPTEIWRMYGDGSRARDVLAWKPRHSLREGLQRTVDWYRAALQGADSSWLESFD
jgi:nucleoside-diphosphate-sugar epimerase